MMRVYPRAMPHSIKLPMALEEMGINYELASCTAPRDPKDCQNQSSADLGDTSSVLVDPQGPDGKHLVLNESATTLIYLAEKYGKLLPMGSAARARVFDQLFSYDPGMGSAMRQTSLFVKPMPEHLSLSTSRAGAEALQLARRLNRVLAQNAFLAGDDFSIADIAHFCWFWRRDFAGLNLTAVPHLKRWSETVAARPAIQRAIARVNAFSARHRLPDRIATDLPASSRAS